MRCLIPGRFVKLFGRAVHCLSKIGDELYLEASEDGLALRTVNSSRSAFGCFLFNESFFHEYSLKKCTNDESDEDDDIQRFKISMKSCLGVFKSLNTIEKNVDTCKLEYDVKETRIVFKLFCRHGIVKTHNLTFQESESLQAVFSKDLCPNLLVAPAKVLIDTAANFPNNCEEVTFCCIPESLTIRNYIEDEPDPSKIVHTEMSLHPEEFDDYRIGVDTDITFCLKEARAVLAFADFVSQSVNIHFSSPGKPVVFSLDGDSLYVADFVLATLMEQTLSSQATQNGETIPEREQTKARQGKSKKGTNGRKNQNTVTIRDGLSDADKARQGSKLVNETTEEQNEPEGMDLRLVSTPPFPSRVTAERGNLNARGNAHTGHCGNEGDDFFSQSFPYKDMLGNASANTDEIERQLNTQERTALSTEISMPCLGDSENQHQITEKQANMEDEVLPSTPPSKKFKSIFFGTVTAPEEIRKRRKLHTTVLAEDTDEEN